MSEQLEERYFEPPYCDYCGGEHESSACRDEDEGPDEEED